ncbi:MAG: pilus assembly protein [Rhodobacteraceae bacterium]|nr:pilus assembly protein [Paracoccaceae bacterium]
MIWLAEKMRRLRSFARDEQGTSTVEFLIISPVLLASFFWMFEIGYVMIQQMMLDRALDMTVREMRLSDSESFTQNYITSAVCDKALIFADCNESLVLELTPIATAADIPNSSISCVNRADSVTPVTSFDTGSRGEVVFLRACMVVDPLLANTTIGIDFTTDESGGLMLHAKSAFLNEPE